jgi:alpha-galactosidase
MIPDTNKFPKGISGLAKTIHDMGLKIGIYSSAGERTCANYPASLEHEETDAKAFAEWGIDCKFYLLCC